MVKNLKIKILKDLKKELKRFNKRINEAIQEQKEANYGCKHFAASKRGAMDLKRELNNLTQFSKVQDEYYRREREKED